MAIIFIRLVIKNTSSLQYNRGRRAARDTWVFGMVTAEFSPARGYFEVVDRRDAATLYPIISRCVRAGTEVRTDDWASYRNLDQRINNAGVHQVVVHRRNFDDPATGVHTQEMESCWNNLKLGLKILLNNKSALLNENRISYVFVYIRIVMIPGPQGQQSVLHLGHATLKEGEMWGRSMTDINRWVDGDGNLTVKLFIYYLQFN